MANQITPNPSVPSQVVQEVKFPKFVNNLGIIPTSYKDSMSYYECLAWLCKFLEETVIPTVNENGEAVEELQNLYVELNDYVTHYFDTLDVQEEINNKLDDMAEAGTLEEIISAYLDSQAVFGYNNVNEMINAVNLQNGSYARTMGYYSKNDGGSGLYKIRTRTFEDVVDGSTIIVMNDSTLVAELIIENSTLSIEQMGGKKNDNTFDNSQYIYNGLKKIQDIGGGTFLLNAGIYECKTSITIDFDIYSTTFTGSHGVPIQNTGSVINYTGENFMFNFNYRCNHFFMENITINCNNNSFASFNLTANKSQFKNLGIRNAIKGMLFNTGTYTRIDNLSFLSENANSEYGIQIGSDMTHYLTEFFYITNSSIDFQNASSGTCLKVIKMEGGLWCENNDFCATLGTAVYIANELTGSSNYYNFDNNNISGCNYGFYFDAKVGNLGGVYINNQRISINSSSVNERYIYTTHSSYYTTDLHLKNMYLRRKNGSVVPTYLYEITTNSCSADSELSVNGGEKFNSPIYCNSDIKSIDDFRNKYSLVLNNNYITSTGDVSVPMSDYHTLIKGSSFTKRQTAVSNSDKNYYVVAINYSNEGVPLAVLRVGETTSSRVNIIMSKEFEYAINPPSP